MTEFTLEAEKENILYETNHTDYNVPLIEADNKYDIVILAVLHIKEFQS